MEPSWGGPEESGKPDAGNQVDEWWTKISESDLGHAVRKAAEYGSADLEVMGQAMQALFPGIETMEPEARRRTGIEMALMFYELGKVARTIGAFARGQIPSDDTYADMTIYAMMVRRVRETGRWP